MRIAIIFVLAIMALLIEPLGNEMGNESTIYSVAVAVEAADLAELWKMESVVFPLCWERGHDETISFTTTSATKSAQIIWISCR